MGAFPKLCWPNFTHYWPTHAWHWWRNSFFIRENLVTFDNSSSTYLPRLVNVVKERPPTVNYFHIRCCYNDFVDFDTVPITQQGEIIFEAGVFMHFYLSFHNKYNGSPIYTFFSLWTCKLGNFVLVDCLEQSHLHKFQITHFFFKSQNPRTTGTLCTVHCIGIATRRRLS